MQQDTQSSSSTTNNVTTENQNGPITPTTEQPTSSSQQLQQTDQSSSSVQQVSFAIPRSISLNKFEEPLLIPPLNFAMVQPGIYRSGYPNKMNFPFLKKYKIKTIVYVLNSII